MIKDMKNRREERMIEEMKERRMGWSKGEEGRMKEMRKEIRNERVTEKRKKRMTERKGGRR